MVPVISHHEKLIGRDRQRAKLSRRVGDQIIAPPVGPRIAELSLIVLRGAPSATRRCWPHPSRSRGKNASGRSAGTLAPALLSPDSSECSAALQRRTPSCFGSWRSC